MLERIKAQERAVKLAAKNPNVLLEWCTGVGKSKAALDIQAMLNPSKTTILVAEVAHKSNWEEEFKKFNREEYLEKTEMHCYASLKNLENHKTDLLILDEGHNANTLIRLEALDTFTAKNVLILSATVNEDIIYNLSQIFGEIVTDVITLQDAINLKMLPTPKVFLVPLTLNNFRKDCITSYTRGQAKKRVVIECDYDERWKYIKNTNQFPHLHLKMKTTQQEKYNHIEEQINYYRDRFFNQRLDYLRNIWLNQASRRKRFLGEAKTDHAIYLINLLKSKQKRFVCFCSSINQADTLGKENSIHSKKNNSLEIIIKFNNKEIDSLFPVGMIQEGQNLTDIEIGVIIQLDKVVRPFIQRFGRTLRAEDPIQILLYYKNTRDEEFLETVYEEVDKEYIYHIDNLNNLKIE